MLEAGAAGSRRRWVFVASTNLTPSRVRREPLSSRQWSSRQFQLLRPVWSANRTKCTVFAATNPKGENGSWYRASFTDWSAIALISRFDIVLVLSDSQDPERDQRLAAHMLDGTSSAGFLSSASRGPTMASSSAAAHEEPWPLERLRQYLEFVRSRFEPTIGDDAQRVLTAYYSMLRAA